MVIGERAGDDAKAEVPQAPEERGGVADSRHRVDRARRELGRIDHDGIVRGQPETPSGEIHSILSFPGAALGDHEVDRAETRHRLAQRAGGEDTSRSRGGAGRPAPRSRGHGRAGSAGGRRRTPRRRNWSGGAAPRAAATRSRPAMTGHPPRFATSTASSPTTAGSESARTYRGPVARRSSIARTDHPGLVAVPAQTPDQPHDEGGLPGASHRDVAYYHDGHSDPVRPPQPAAEQGSANTHGRRIRQGQQGQPPAQAGRPYHISSRSRKAMRCTSFPRSRRRPPPPGAARAGHESPRPLRRPHLPGKRSEFPGLVRSAGARRTRPRSHGAFPGRRV